MTKRALTPVEKAYYRGFAAALGILARDFHEADLAAHIAKSRGVSLVALRAAEVASPDLDAFKKELAQAEKKRR